MNENIAFPQLPFLTREMLKFGNKATLELAVTSQVRQNTTLHIRLITREGTSELTHVNSGSGNAVTTIHKISDFPILFSVVDDSETLKIGDAWARVSLRIDGEIVYQLAAGHVYRQKGISWPPSPYESVMPGRGGVRLIYGDNPAAGNEIYDLVPGGQMWRIRAAQVTLVTDATVANRRVHLVLGGDIQDGIHFFGSVDQAASTTRTYHFTAVGAGFDGADANHIIVPIASNIYLPGTDSINTETTNLQAGDNFGSMNLRIEQFYEEDN